MAASGIHIFPYLWKYSSTDICYHLIDNSLSASRRGYIYEKYEILQAVSWNYI